MSSADTDAKVLKALSLFAQLRVSVDHSTTQELPTLTPTSAQQQQPQFNPLVATGALPANESVSAAIYTEGQLQSLSADELRARLVKSEALMQLLHQKNQALQHRIKFLESNSGSVLTSSTPPTASVEAHTLFTPPSQQRRRTSEEHARLAQQLAEKDRNASELRTKIEALKRKLRENEASRQQQQQHQQQSLVTSVSGDTGTATDVAELRSQVKRLERHKKEITARLFQTERELQRMHGEERQRAAAAAVPLQGNTSTAPTSMNPLVNGGSRRSSSDSEPPTILGAGSAQVAVLQDTITALQFRLHQTATQCQQVSRVQLDALLGPSGGASKRGGYGSVRTETSQVNAEVKKLFAAMKQRLIDDAVQHETERARMNELLFALEKDIASLTLL